MKLKNIPIVFLLFISALTSFLLGCGGGGSAPGGTASSGSSPATTSGFAPATLTVGTVFTFTGNSSQPLVSGGTGGANTSITITITSATTATYKDNFWAPLTPSTSAFTYAQNSSNVGVLRLTSVTYGSSYVPATGLLITNLTFAAATAGTYIAAASNYNESGSFAYVAGP